MLAGYRGFVCVRVGQSSCILPFNPTNLRCADSQRSEELYTAMRDFIDAANPMTSGVYEVIARLFPALTEAALRMQVVVVKLAAACLVASSYQLLRQRRGASRCSVPPR